MTPPPIFGELHLDSVGPEEMDALLAEGWRHFGSHFFRYSYSMDENGGVQCIQPLRIPLARFTPNKSQQRVLRMNADLDVQIVPAVVDAERESMFQQHKARFRANIPETLRTFIASDFPATHPCQCLSVEARLEGKLIAVSYLDVGRTSVSSVYAMFDPAHSRRSLGIFTFLKEVEWATANGFTWLYPGYATVQSSIYDYKKSFRPLEYFDWSGQWLPLP